MTAEPQTWTVNDAEFAGVSRLTREQRFEHFLSRTSDWEWAWSLEGDSGLVVQSDDEGTRYVCLWPHPRYAEACAVEAWEDATPTAIEIHELVDSRLPKMEGDGVMLAVFPTPEDGGLIVPPAGLREALQAELAQYE